MQLQMYPISWKGKKYLRAAYGWATKARRAQGATMDAIGLWFNRRLPDRGAPRTQTLEPLCTTLAESGARTGCPLHGEVKSFLSTARNADSDRRLSHEPPWFLARLRTSQCTRSSAIISFNRQECASTAFMRM